jgi:hypothetical protein
MANITVTTWQRRAKHIGRGLKMLTGAILLSTTSSFPASGIEKHFRRCDNIILNMKTCGLLQYRHSATRLYGTIAHLRSGNVFGQAALAAATSATFTATGF